MPGRAIQGKYLGSVRRQRGQGKKRGQEFLLWFPWEKMGEAGKQVSDRGV